MAQTHEAGPLEAEFSPVLVVTDNQLELYYRLGEQTRGLGASTSVDSWISTQPPGLHSAAQALLQMYPLSILMPVGGRPGPAR